MSEMNQVEQTKAIEELQARLDALEEPRLPVRLIDGTTSDLLGLKDLLELFEERTRPSCHR